MVIKAFPPIDTADEYGLLAIGGDLDVESLLLAYRNGIFPWPFDESFVAWFSPPKRAILWLKDFHLPRSARKELTKAAFKITVDQEFDQVIRACAELKNRPGQSGTWIMPELIDAYIEFHRAGYAHSIETWDKGKLVGGLYGVAIDSFFAGESMFYREPNASKAALLFLVDRLRSHGVEWIDCQVMTPHFQQLGAVEISRERYIGLLHEVLRRDQKIF